MDHPVDEPWLCRFQVRDGEDRCDLTRPLHSGASHEISQNSQSVLFGGPIVML